MRSARKASARNTGPSKPEQNSLKNRSPNSKAKSTSSRSSTSQAMMSSRTPKTSTVAGRGSKPRKSAKSLKTLQKGSSSETMPSRSTFVTCPHLMKSWQKSNAASRIHRCRQHESRRKSHRNRRARNGHRTIFQRLAHHFQHVSLKLWQLVQKQHAIVTQRHFPRPRHCAPTDQSRIADRVVRRPERPRPH